MNTRITKYAVLEKTDIIEIASIIGGIPVPVDDKAAAFLHKKKGNYILKGQEIVDFLGTSLSGKEDSEKRQVEALKSIYNQLYSKNIILTALLMQQIISKIESNILVPEFMQNYNNFIAKKNWTMKTFKLPVIEKRENNLIIFDPDLEKSRKLLFE